MSQEKRQINFFILAAFQIMTQGAYTTHLISLDGPTHTTYNGYSDKKLCTTNGVPERVPHATRYGPTDNSHTKGCAHGILMGQRSTGRTRCSGFFCFQSGQIGNAPSSGLPLDASADKSVGAHCFAWCGVCIGITPHTPTST